MERDDLSRRAALGCLAVFALFMAAVRLQTYGAPAHMDVATYALIAREWLSGGALYIELFDHKPPGIFWIYAAAQLVAGDGPLHIYLLGLAAAVLTLFGVYVAGCASSGGRRAGLWAAAFWAVVSTDLVLEANQPNGEAFLNAAQVWGFALLVRATGPRTAWGRIVGVTALFVVASFFKHTAVAVAAALAIAHSIRPPHGDRRRALVEVGVLAAVGIVAWGTLFAVFGAVGQLEPLYDALIGYNRAYAGSILGNLGRGLQPTYLFPVRFSSLWPLVLLAGVGGLASRGARPTRFGTFALAYGLASWITVCLPGSFYDHYYQLWLPVLVLAAGTAVPSLERYLATFPRRWLASGLACAVLVVLVGLQAPSLAQSPSQWSVQQSGTRLLYSVNIAEAVNGLLAPDERFYLWGHQVELYYYSGRPLPARSEFLTRCGSQLARVDPGCGGRFSSELRRERDERVRKELEANPPELVILSRRHDRRPRYAVLRWIREEYAPLPAVGPIRNEQGRDYLFLSRKGGALERRLAAGIADRPTRVSGRRSRGEDGSRPSAE